MKGLIFIFLLLAFIGCDKWRSSSPSPSQAPLQTPEARVSSQQIRSVQNIVDELNQKEADLQKLAETIQNYPTISENSWLKTDKGDLSSQWTELKEQFESFRQIVKQYLDLLQKEQEQPSEPFSFRHNQTIQETANIFKLWDLRLIDLDESIDELGQLYLDVKDQYQLSEIQTKWTAFDSSWSAFFKKLKKSDDH